jgi:hypothetical protein
MKERCVQIHQKILLRVYILLDVAPGLGPQRIDMRQIYNAVSTEYNSVGGTWYQAIVVYFNVSFLHSSEDP